MIEHWEFHPRVGWGPLEFGMSPLDVLKAAPQLGNVRSERNEQGIRVEHRTIELPTLHYEERKLVTIDSDKYCSGLFVSGVDIYKSDPICVLKALLQLDPIPFELLGSLYFSQLEFSIEGFYDLRRQKTLTMAEVRQDDFRVAGALAPGQYDVLRSEMTVPVLNVG